MAKRGLGKGLGAFFGGRKSQLRKENAAEKSERSEKKKTT